MDYNKIPPYFENENDSRKKAKITLTQIFENKMLNIDTIKTIISEFQKYENQNSIEVFNRIERNINESEVSTKKIGDVIKHTEELNSKYQEFFKNWEKITKPLNDYGDELENLMLSKKNVSMMRQNLNVYVKIKEQIKELRDLINSNPSNVVVVYKQIRYLAYLRTALLEKINKTTGISMTEKLCNLADHLLCVKQFEDEFFGIFWSYFDSILYFAEEKPEFLVKLLRLIEEDAEYMKNIQMQFQMYNVRLS
jgi:hypothetical protein